MCDRNMDFVPKRNQYERLDLNFEEENTRLFLSLLEKQRKEELPLSICKQINDSINITLHPDCDAADEFREAVDIIENENFNVAFVGPFYGDENLTHIGRWFLSVLRTEEKLPALIHSEIDWILLNAAEDFLHNAWLKIDSKEKASEMIRLFPTLLPNFENNINAGDHPIILQSRCDESISHTIKRMSLIPFTAKLGFKLNQFEKWERGGVLAEPEDGGNNVLQNLCSSFDNKFAGCSPEKDQTLVEETALGVMKTLRRMKLFKKGDIQRYNLVQKLFFDESRSWPSESKTEDHVISEKRFRFLTDWDPEALTAPFRDDDKDNEGLLPIHHSTDYGSIDNFLLYLKAGIRHFPNKLGFVFSKRVHTKTVPKQKDNESTASTGVQNESRYINTYQIPYFKACEKFGEENVEREVIDKVLADCPETQDPKKLLLLGAEEDVDLSGLYLLLRRDPAHWSTVVSEKDSSSNTKSSKRDMAINESVDRKRRKLEC